MRNPFYYGVFVHKGEIHQGIHPPMISKKMFDDIQRLLLDVGRPQNGYRKQKGFIFLRFARCASCGGMITAERHIKKSGLKFYYYRCTHKNKKKRCENCTYVRQEKFETEVRRNAELLTLSDEWKERFLARVENWSEEAADSKHLKIAELKDQLSALKSKLQRINNAFAEGTLDVDEFKDLKNPLVPKKIEIEQKIIALETSRADRLEPLRNWILEANQTQKLLPEENVLKLKSFLLRVGSNRLLDGQSLNISFKSPWNFLALINRAVRGTASVFAKSEPWWRRGELNPCPDRSLRELLHA
jgi:hypothetical protein